jgi:hypothetical protein
VGKTLRQLKGQAAGATANIEYRSRIANSSELGEADRKSPTPASHVLLINFSIIRRKDRDHAAPN